MGILNITSIFLLFSLFNFILLAIAIFRLKKHINADGVSLMFYGFIGMIVFSFISLILENLIEEVFWLEMFDMGVNALLITIVTYGFYRLVNWLIIHS